MNLRRRGMKINHIYFPCNRLDENGAHLFLKFNHVSTLWSKLLLDHERIERRLLSSLPSTRDIIDEILKLKESTQRKVEILLYVWWSERCAVREGENPQNMKHLAQLVSTYAEECLSLKQQVQILHRLDRKRSGNVPLLAL